MSTTVTKDRITFRNRIRGMLNEASPGVYLDDDINDWINDGQRDVAFKAKCIETTSSITTVASQKAYPFVAVNVDTIMYGNVSLQKITPKQAGHIKENGTAPQFFWQWGTNVYIHPTPAAILTLTAYLAGEPDDMDDDGDTTNLPLTFQDLIILYAVYRGLIRAGKHQQAASVYGIYIRELSFHQTNDAGEYKAPESFDDMKIPSRYTQAQGQQGKQ